MQNAVNQALVAPQQGVLARAAARLSTAEDGQPIRVEAMNF
jgi:hypothetical protein